MTAMNRIFKTFKWIGLSLMLGLSLASCEAYLDKEPDSTISEETAFVNFRNFIGVSATLFHLKPEIRTLESTHDHPHFRTVQLPFDILTNSVRGSCGKCTHLRNGKLVCDLPYPAVGRTKIMSPLTDAMRLINDEYAGRIFPQY